jgi:hypothetical protein
MPLTMEQIHAIRPYPSVERWRQLRIEAGLDPDPPPTVAPSYPAAVELGSPQFDAGREGICPVCRWSQHYYTQAGDDHTALACVGCVGVSRREKRNQAEQAARAAREAEEAENKRLHDEERAIWRAERKAAREAAKAAAKEHVTG